MTMDNTNVVPPVVAPDEKQTTPPAGDTGTVPPATPEPLTKAEVQAMVAEATARAVAEAKEIGRRELQSQQDKNRAELAKEQRRARIAESTLKSTQETLGRLDPDAAKDLELARLRAQAQGMTDAEQEAELEKQQAAYYSRFVGTLTNLVTELGIDPKDPRIDWAEGSKDYFEAQERVLKSVAVINKDKVIQTQNEFEKRLKALEGKTSKEDEEANKEANSVNTSTSTSGVLSQSDKDFLAKFGSGELPFSKENKERYDKITKSYD